MQTYLVSFLQGIFVPHSVGFRLPSEVHSHALYMPGKVCCGLLQNMYFTPTENCSWLRRATLFSQCLVSCSAIGNEYLLCNTKMTCCDEQWIGMKKLIVHSGNEFEIEHIKKIDCLKLPGLKT